MAGEGSRNLRPLAGRLGAPLGRLRGLVGRLARPAVRDALAAPAAAFALTLYRIVPTLAPGVASWDTAEFQTVAPVLGTAHPTGYPSYVILGWLASIVLQPFGDPAYRMNLLQAILAAVAVAGATGIVQLLTGRRLIALAAGIMLACTQLFWRLSTHADPHMFHLALVAILFAVLLVWDRRRRSGDPETARHSGRWLVAAAGIYGVAVANHSLALLLPPAILLFVLSADRRFTTYWLAVGACAAGVAAAAAVVFGVDAALQFLSVLMLPALALFALTAVPALFGLLGWRTIVACAAVLAGTVAVLFLELPVRAAMHAPLIYGHPDDWSGLQYVVLAEQFRGSLSDPFGDLPNKYAGVMDLITGWLGQFAMVSALGLVTSLFRRPRFVILTGLAAVATCVFSASYANADIERYYLVPLLVAFVWAGVGIADAIDLTVAVARTTWDWVNAAPEKMEARPTEAASAEADSLANPAPADVPYAPRGRARWVGWAILAGESVLAGAMLASTVSVVPTRQMPGGTVYGAVSEANNTADAASMRQILAPADQGGLPQNAVIVSWWSVSTTLWYGQKVLGLRPDVYIVDDRTRLDDNLGEVQDVFNRFLGDRPLFTTRLDGGVDGIEALSRQFQLQQWRVTATGTVIYQVLGQRGSS